MPLLKTLRNRLPWFLRRGGECSHTGVINDVTPSADGCEECLKIGDTWYHLRMCLVCGKVGCCDQSKNKHATAHFHDGGHPIVQSHQPGEGWRWCYIDETMLHT